MCRVCAWVYTVYRLTVPSTGACRRNVRALRTRPGKVELCTRYACKRFDNTHMVSRFGPEFAKWSSECGRKIPAWGLASGVLPPSIPTFLEKSAGKRKKAKVSGYTYIYIYFGKRVIYICRFPGGWTSETRMDTRHSGGPRSVDHFAKWWTVQSLTFIGASNSQTYIGELRRWRCRRR